MKLGKKFWLTFDKVGRQPCGYFQWYDPPVPDHLERVLIRMINRAKEAELQRDKARFKARILMLVVIILSVIVVMQFICNKFH